jgi:hypothetical protein
MSHRQGANMQDLTKYLTTQKKRLWMVMANKDSQTRQAKLLVGRECKYVALLTSLTFLFPFALGAQAKDCPTGATGVLCRLENTLRKMDSAGKAGTDSTRGVTSVSARDAGIDMTIPSGGPLSIGATGSTGAARFQSIVVRWTVIDDGSQLRLPAPPPAPEIRRQVLGCGPDRACVASADLRVLKIETYGQSIASNIPFTADVTVENHGRRATATTEGLVCLNGLDGSRCKNGMSDSFVIPSLAPGERAIFRRTVSGTICDYCSTTEIGVSLDPDESVDDFSRANNTAVVRNVRLEKPSIVILQERKPPEVTGDSRFQPVHVIRMQNPSRSISTGEMPMMAEGGHGSMVCPRYYDKEPIVLPAIPPKGIVEISIIYPRLFYGCTTQYGTIAGFYSWNYVALPESRSAIQIDRRWSTQYTFPR